MAEIPIKPHGEKELYDFENEVLAPTSWGDMQHTLDLLYAVLWGVWIGENGELDGCPTLSPKVCESSKLNGAYTNCYDPNTNKIHILEGQRTLIVLLHEITHAMGFDNHDWRFRKKYFFLLDKYVGIQRKWLENHYRAWTVYKRKTK